jgi:hypothetical protein
MIRKQDMEVELNVDVQKLGMAQIQKPVSKPIHPYPINFSVLF